MIHGSLMRFTNTAGRQLRSIACIAGILLLQGCVLINPTDPYAGMRRGPGYRLRPHQTGAAGQAALRGPITLDQAIATALELNPGLARAAQAVDAADARRDYSVGAVLPELGLRGGYAHTLDDQRLVQARAPGEEGVFDADIFSTDLVVSMPLFAGGRLISEIQARELLEAAARHRLARTRRELVFNVSSVFYRILAQRYVIESLEFSRDAMREHLKRVNDLIDAQKAAPVDRLRIEVRLADLEQQLANQRSVLAIQERTLTSLIGIAGSSEPVTPSGELRLLATESPGVGESLVRAFEQRADYQAARAALEAQAKRVDRARGERWPTVTLQGSYGYRWAASPTQPVGRDREADANGGPSRERYVGPDREEDVGRVDVLVNVPLFKGGRIAAQIREQRALLAAERSKLLELELQIELQVETAVLNIQSARERVAATRTAISQAQESLRIEREKYALAKGSITDVLDAQTALLNAQTTHYNALADHSVALDQLKLATGEQ